MGQLKEWNLIASSTTCEEVAGLRRATRVSRPTAEITGYSGAMVEPTYMPLIGYPQAWSGSTNGPVTGEVVIAQIQEPADLDKWKGKLRGKIGEAV